MVGGEGEEGVDALQFMTHIKVVGTKINCQGLNPQLLLGPTTTANHPTTRRT